MFCLNLTLKAHYEKLSIPIFELKWKQWFWNMPYPWLIGTAFLGRASYTVWKSLVSNSGVGTSSQGGWINIILMPPYLICNQYAHILTVFYVHIFSHCISILTVLRFIHTTAIKQKLCILIRSISNLLPTSPPFVRTNVVQLPNAACVAWTPLVEARGN